MLELARKSFYLATVLIVLCAIALTAGRLFSMYPEYVQQFANTRLAVQDIQITGLKSHWRLTNPIIEIEHIRLPEGSARNVVMEVAVLESLIRNQLVARRLFIDELNLDIELTRQPGELAERQGEFDFLNLIDQIQSNFERVRHTDELELSAVLTLKRDLASQRLNMKLHAVNQEGVHRYRAKLWQEDGIGGGTAEFVADAVDTLLDLRTGDYQMSLKVNGLVVDLPLLTGNSRFPRYLLEGEAKWERAKRRVQGHLDADLMHIDRGTLNAHFESAFVQLDEEPARFKLQSARFEADSRDVPLPDLVFAIDDDSLFGSTYNVQLQELVPITTDFITSGENQLRWPNGIAIRGTFQRYEFLLDSSGFHWYAEARDLESKSFENLPRMQLESGALYGNSRQIALDVSNSPSGLYLDSHFETPWQFASVSGFAMTDIRNQQVGLYMHDFTAHIASDDAENPDSQLDVSSLLKRDSAEIQINELIHEPVSATFRGSIRHAQGDVPDYRVAILIESRNTLLPAHQTIEFLPSKIVEDLTRWRKQYVESASFFGTRVAYMTFRDDIFAQNEREMSIEGQFTNGTVTYQADWPQLTNLGGTWHVNNDSVIVTTDRITVQGTELEDAVARFPFGVDEPFEINFAATAKTQDLLDFVQASELKTILPAIDASWHGGGLVSIDADLSFPINSDDDESTTAKGKPGNFQISFEMHDASLYLPNYDIEFHELNGTAKWNSPHTLEASLTRGTFFDQPMDGEIVTKHDGDQSMIEFRLGSRINAENALTISGLDEVESGRGITDFEAKLTVYPGIAEATKLLINSDLSGIEFETLKSVTVESEVPNPSDLRFEFHEDRTELTVLSRDVRGWITLSGTPTSIREGALALGQDTAVPDRLTNRLHLAGVVSDWAYGSDDSEKLDVPIVLTNVAIERFNAFDLEFGNVLINGSYGIDNLDVTVESDEFDGTILKRPDSSSTEIHATQLRWTLPNDEESDDPLDVSVMSQIEPTIVSIDDLLIRTDSESFESWGQWNFIMSPTDYGIEISDLTADTRGLRIETESPIKWIRETNSTEFDGRIYGENLGSILEAWDFNASVESEQFEVNANIQWSGSPLAIDIVNSSGQFQASATNGRFIEIDQGGDMLRLISLLNFSKILNRLTLDFRDVAQQGLHYDSASMDVTLDNGLLSFKEPLRIDGPGARLRLAGKVNTRSGELNNELTVRIPLHKGLQTYVAYLAATNPAATVAYLLGTLIISEPIKALLTAQYEISGDLDNPVLTRVGLEPTQANQVATPQQ